MREHARPHDPSDSSAHRASLSGLAPITIAAVRLRSRARIAVIFAVLGCGSGPAPGGTTGSSTTGSSTTGASTTGASTEATATDSPTTDGTGGPGTGLPQACEGLLSPFTSADCLIGLRERCRAQADEPACQALDSLAFDGGSFVISCGWAKVVVFADVAACTIDATHGRCEAGIEQPGHGCPDRCTDAPDLYASLRASAEDLELIEMPCAAAGHLLDGPLGPGAAIGAPPPDEGSTCAPNVTPPAPAICACAPQACAAR